MSKQEVLKLMDEGELLCHAFFTRKTEWSINKNRVTSRTAESVLLTEGVKLASMKFEGVTKHYYKKEA